MQPEQSPQNQTPQPPVNPVGGSPAFAPSPPQPVAPVAFQQNAITLQTIKNYRIPAILVTVLCSLPLGVVALMYSSSVDKNLKAGDIVGAQKAAKTAKLWVILGVAIGVPLSLIYIASQFSSK